MKNLSRREGSNGWRRLEEWERRGTREREREWKDMTNVRKNSDIHQEKLERQVKGRRKEATRESAIRKVQEMKS